MIGTNCYLVINEETKDTVMVDPGAYPTKLKNAVKEQGLKLKAVLLTHAHFDHIMGLNALKKELNAEALICKDDLVISDNINEFTRLFNWPDSVPPVYEKYIKDGDIIPSVAQAYIFSNLFSGDTLFRGSVGRTDLFGGNFSKLSDSIKNKLFKLDNDIKVFPGHGPMTTIGYEKKYNEIL